MKKRYIKPIILFIIDITIILVGVFLISKSKLNFKQDIVKYNENSNIDYKVYLKENNFFEEDYLGPGKPYITSLIDYLDINFRYNFNTENLRNGKYLYYIRANISANISNSDSNYWEKSYPIIGPKIFEYNKKNNFQINENIKIDYQKYNDLLIEFKKEYGLAIDGKLKIFLYIENYIDGNITSQKLPVKMSKIMLTIPLTKATIEVPIELKNVNDSNFIASELIYDTGKIFLVLRLSGIALMLVGFLLFLYIVYIIKKNIIKKTEYEKKLNKILKTYDGIIVSVDALPNLKEFEIIDVSSFTELLDAHSEIRKPINYFNNSKFSIFILINDKMLWRFVLRNEDGSDKNEKK